MDAKIQIRRLIELELRAAVATDQIEVYFQPIVSVATRRIVGFEALARWRSALLGPVSPAEFIPIVEEIGLMEEMGAAMLRRACKACAGWPERGLRVGQPVIDPVPQRQSRKDDSRAPSRRPISRPSGWTSKSRNRSCSRIGATRAAPSMPCVPRAARFARRFRHRIFELELSAQLPARPHQDRPLLHHGAWPSGTRVGAGGRRFGHEPQARHDAC